MTFNKYRNYKQFSYEKIDIGQLVDLIKDNPQKEEILMLRSSEYKSSEYNTIKSKLATITPHGTFTDSKKGSLESLSGYMYFDIDGFASTEDLDDTIKKLNDAFPLTFICKSCGGRGLAFLLKVNGITKDSFVGAHAFVRNEFSEAGYNLDNAAVGVNRKWIVSYDPEVIYNKNAVYDMDNLAYEKFNVSNKTSSKKISTREPDLEFDVDLESEIIPFNVLSKEIKTESGFKGEISGDFVVEEMDFYKILYPKVIADGTKHKTYIRIINALYWLNTDITQHQVFSYLFYVNRIAQPPMAVYKLRSLVTNICSSIDATGEIKLKTRTKIIHFNQDAGFSTREKQSMGAKIGGALKANRTKESIENTKEVLKRKNIVPTQKAVVMESGISLSTVKRHWNKNKIEIFSLDLTSKKEVNKSELHSEFDYVEEYYSNEEKPLVEDDFFDDMWL
jgi:hypothetical protein